MHISIAEAINQIRNDLREAIVESAGQDILFTPKEITLELGVTFGTEVKAGGGFKLLTFLDLSGEAKSSNNRQHKIVLKLEASDAKGSPIKVRSKRVPGGL
ncbi:trypco2 family protein [Bradyrhizobium yuanmingense]|uniref:Trypsin-co-occurring domain-containing protein n=1 Tax=Bradyrhizobium yuanmingense TaxID=108015 RepID=A0ABV4GKJ7_9BRAD|nr:trypco2 family protein [Bradyrhizobium yuanmingense]